VRWSLNIAPTGTFLTLDDSGPGIPDDEMHMVTKRFFRGRHKCAIGSGLGLAIVQTALEKDGLALRLQNRSPGAGLRAQIFVVADRVAMDAADADATTQEVVIAV